MKINEIQQNWVQRGVAKCIVNELGNTKLPYKHTTTTKQGAPTDVYSFVSPKGNKIELNVYTIDNFADAPTFLTVDGGGIGVDFDLVTDFGGKTQDITGTGNAPQILSTVHNILTDVIKEKQPKYIVFGAHETSRQSLYDKWSKLIARQMGYRVMNPDEFLSDMHKAMLGDSKYYALEKKQ